MSRLAFLMVAAGLWVMPTAVGATAAQPGLTTSTITFAGKMLSGRDNAGSFGAWGASLANKNFTLSYTVKTFANSSTGAGLNAIGLSITVTGQGPTTVDFNLTIAGTSLTGSANVAGSVTTVDGLGGLAGGRKDSVTASVTGTTKIDGVPTTIDISASVSSTLHNFVNDVLSSRTLPAVNYTLAAGDQSNGQFTYGQSPLTTLSSGYFKISSVSIASSTQLVATAPVPEPGEWAMLGAGLALTGWAARRRRRSSKSWSG